MATCPMFGKLAPEVMRPVSAERTNDAIALIKKYGGESKAGYGLGEVDSPPQP